MGMRRFHECRAYLTYVTLGADHFLTFTSLSVIPHVACCQTYNQHTSHSDLTPHLQIASLLSPNCQTMWPQMSASGTDHCPALGTQLQEGILPCKLIGALLSKWRNFSFTYFPLLYTEKLTLCDPVRKENTLECIIYECYILDFLFFISIINYFQNSE